MGTMGKIIKQEHISSTRPTVYSGIITLLKKVNQAYMLGHFKHLSNRQLLGMWRRRRRIKNPSEDQCSVWRGLWVKSQSENLCFIMRGLCITRLHTQ